MPSRRARAQGKFEIRKARTRGSAGLPRARIAWREVLEPRHVSQSFLLSNPCLSTHISSSAFTIHRVRRKDLLELPSSPHAANFSLLRRTSRERRQDFTAMFSPLLLEPPSPWSAAAKLNHLIQPLVRSIRGETDRLLQRKSEGARVSH